MQSDAQRQEIRSAIKDAISRGDARAALQHGRNLAASGKPADVMFCASQFAKIEGALAAQPGVKRLKTYVVRSVTVEPILPFLSVEAALAGYVLDVRPGGYGSYADELMNPQTALAQYKPELVLVVLDLEEIAGKLPDLCADGKGASVDEEIEQCVLRIAQLLRSFRSGSAARLVLQGCVVPDRTSLGDVGEANVAYSLTSAVQTLNLRL